MRRFSRVLLLTLVAVVVGLYPLLAPTPHRIDHAHYDLIQNGMTRADVEAIFGAPSGRYDWAEQDNTRVSSRVIRLEADGTPQMRHDFSHDLIVPMSWIPGPEWWVSRHGAFPIHFNIQGRVVYHGTSRSVRIEVPWKRWWGLVWKK